MVHHSLNNANTSLLHKVLLSTTHVFFFGLVFYVGEYYGLQLPVPVVAVVGNTESLVMPTSSRNLTAKKRKQSKKNSKSSRDHDHGRGRGDDDMVLIGVNSYPVGALCDQTSDCVVPPGLDHAVCRQIPYCIDAYCQSGQPGAYCGRTSDCVVPPGLEHPVCRGIGNFNTCQSGQSSASCGQTSDCVVPHGLDHAVCRKEKCQRWVL